MFGGALRVKIAVNRKEMNARLVPMSNLCKFGSSETAVRIVSVIHYICIAQLFEIPVANPTCIVI